MKTCTFHVSGTHCASCKILIEDILNDQSFVKNARVDLRRQTVEVELGDDQEPLTIASDLTKLILKLDGYTFSVEKSDSQKVSENAIWTALPIGIGFGGILFALRSQEF